MTTGPIALCLLWFLLGTASSVPLNYNPLFRWVVVLRSDDQIRHRITSTMKLDRPLNEQVMWGLLVMLHVVPGESAAKPRALLGRWHPVPCLGIQRLAGVDRWSVGRTGTAVRP